MFPDPIYAIADLVSRAEHSHEQFLTSVAQSLQANNPDGIVDSVFGLLGAAAAIKGAGKITVTSRAKCVFAAC